MNAIIEPVTKDSPHEHSKFLGTVAVVALLMIIATWVAGYITRQVSNQRVQDYFNREADGIANTYYNKLHTNIVVLEGLRAMWNASGDFSYKSFTDYVSSLDLDSVDKTGVSKYFYLPAVERKDVPRFISHLNQEKNLPKVYEQFTVHPESAESFAYPAAYFYPMEGSESSLGIDFASFPERLDAIAYARDNNTLATTKNVTFQVTQQPGFFFVLPLYEPGSPTERTAERKAAFAGVVGASFRSESAFEQIFGAAEKAYPYLDFQVYQGDSTTPDRLLYDYDHKWASDTSRFTTTRIVRLDGQTWTITVQSKPSLSIGSKEERLPGLVFFFGLVSTTILVIGSLLAFLRHLKTHKT